MAPPFIALEVVSFSPSVETSIIWKVPDFVAEHGKSRSFRSFRAYEMQTFRANLKFTFSSDEELDAFEKKLHLLREDLKGRSAIEIKLNRLSNTQKYARLRSKTLRRTLTLLT